MVNTCRFHVETGQPTFALARDRGVSEFALFVITTLRRNLAANLLQIYKNKESRQFRIATGCQQAATEAGSDDRNVIASSPGKQPVEIVLCAATVFSSPCR